MRTGLVFDVRDHGAKGDGCAIDSPSINAAIVAAVGADVDKAPSSTRKGSVRA